MTAAPPLIVLSPRDNIAVAVRPLAAGETAMIGDETLPLRANIPLGHKVALRPITAGEKIIKYGSAIGSATEAIAPGAHVHTHNMKSDYIPTYDRAHQGAFLKGS